MCDVWMIGDVFMRLIWMNEKLFNVKKQENIERKKVD